MNSSTAAATTIQHQINTALDELGHYNPVTRSTVPAAPPPPASADPVGAASFAGTRFASQNETNSGGSVGGVLHSLVVRPQEISVPLETCRSASCSGCCGARCRACGVLGPERSVSGGKLQDDPSLWVVNNHHETDAYVSNAIDELEMEAGIVIAHVMKADVHNNQFFDPEDYPEIQALEAVFEDKIPDQNDVIQQVDSLELGLLKENLDGTHCLKPLP